MLKTIFNPINSHTSKGYHLVEKLQNSHQRSSSQLNSKAEIINLIHLGILGTQFTIWNIKDIQINIECMK